MKIGIVSGYFNPVHAGHLDYINAAKKQSDKLIVIVNNDHQVKLKGGVLFMNDKHRLEIICNLRSVDEAVLSVDVSRNVCETIKCLREKYPQDDLTFFNSGDRVIGNTDTAEIQLCDELGINFFILPFPKRYSSSDLLKEVVIQANKRRLI